MDPEKKNLILANLAGVVSTDLIENLKRLSFTLDAQSIKIPAPNHFIRDFFERSLVEPIKGASIKILGYEPSVTFYVDESLPTESSSPVPSILPPKRSPSGVVVGEKYTFEAFVSGPANEFPVAACRSIAQMPGKEYNPLLLYGKTGVGKTHLLQATYNFVTKKNPYLKVIYTTTEAFLNHFVDSIQTNKMKNFKEKYREADFFIMDDIQLLQGKESTQEEFLNLFNHLYSTNRQIVLAANVHPDHMFDMGDPLKSRLHAGLVVRAEPPTYEIRMAILKKKLELTNRTLPEDVIELLASRFVSNVRLLESALIKVFGYSVILNRPIDLNLAREALSDMLENAENVAVQDISTIVRCVAKYYKMESKTILKNTNRQGTLQRHICIYIAHKTFTLPVRKIMQYFNLGSTSTVIHAVRKIERLYRNTKLKKDLSLLIQELKANS